MNDIDQRVIKTQKNIEQALLRLLRKKPLNKITITELCKVAKITRRTFYHHYKNVQVLFSKLIERLLTELEESMIKSRKERLASKGILLPQFSPLFTHVFEYKAYYDVIFNINTYFSLYEMFYNRVKTIVKESLNEMKTSSTHNTKFEVAYYANGIIGVILEWRSQNYQQSVDDLNKLSIKMILKNNSLQH